MPKVRAVCYFLSGLLLVGIFLDYLRPESLFRPFARDFLPYRCTGDIVHKKGVAAVYNLDDQKVCQQSLLREFSLPGDLVEKHQPLPMLYPPIFAVMFVPLIYFSPIVSLFLFYVLSALVLFYALWRIDRLLGERHRRWQEYRFAVSVPLLYSFIWCQIGPLMAVAVSEALAALRGKREAKSGIWLSALLVKPQSVLLLVPALLVGKKWSILGGFLSGAAALAALSVALVGAPGVKNILDLYSQFAAGLPSAASRYHISIWAVLSPMENFMPQGVAAGLALISCMLVLAAVWRVWKGVSSGDVGVPSGLLAALLGSALLSPHFHSHTLLILIPIMMVLSVESRDSWECFGVSLIDLYILIPNLALLTALVGWPAVYISSVALSLLSAILLLRGLFFKGRV